MIVQAEVEFLKKLYTEEAEEIAQQIQQLHSDEAVLDSVFDRTKYGKEVEEMAHQLAQSLIEDMQSGGEISTVIGELKEKIAQGKEKQPEVSPALKQKTGRAR